MTDNPLFKIIRSNMAQGRLSSEAKSEITAQFGVKRALMVLDSCGFTRVSRKSGILHYLSCLIQMRDIALPLLARHGNPGIRLEADNIYADFDSPTDAFKAAFAVHEAVVAQAIPLSETEIFRVCIGIGYGTVLKAGHEGYYGNEMNIASKLGEDVADGNEVLLSEAAYQAIAQTAGKAYDFETRSMHISGNEIAYFATQYTG